jgi:hypothetical protein
MENMKSHEYYNTLKNLCRNGYSTVLSHLIKDKIIDNKRCKQLLNTASSFVNLPSPDEYFRSSPKKKTLFKNKKKCIDVIINHNKRYFYEFLLCLYQTNNNLPPEITKIIFFYYYDLPDIFNSLHLEDMIKYYPKILQEKRFFVNNKHLEIYLSNFIRCEQTIHHLSMLKLMEYITDFSCLYDQYHPGLFDILDDIIDENISSKDLKRLTQFSIDFNCKNSNGTTYCHYRLSSGDDFNMYRLIKCGANIDLLECNGNNQTILILLLNLYLKKTKKIDNGSELKIKKETLDSTRLIKILSTTGVKMTEYHINILKKIVRYDQKMSKKKIYLDLIGSEYY